MLAQQVMKQELQLKLEQLPASRMQEVLDYVSFLLSQPTRQVAPPVSATTLPVGQDPLATFIGAVAHGTLAQGLDEEVYGA